MFCKLCNGLCFLRYMNVLFITGVYYADLIYWRTRICGGKLAKGAHFLPNKTVCHENYSDDSCQPGMWIWTSALVTWFGTLRLLFQMIKDLSDLHFHEVQHTDFYKEGVCVLLLVLRVNIRMWWKINAFSKTPDSFQCLKHNKSHFGG